MRRKIIILALLLLLFSFASMIMAQDTMQNVEQKIMEYQTKLDSIRKEKNTLSSQIQYMDTQIYLTELRILDTESKIFTTQKEIELLTARIENLDSSLDHLSKLLIKRIVDGYKKGGVSFFALVLNSDNADDLINRIKYEKTAKNNNQKLLIHVQETKLNFEEQKKLREDKKNKLAALTVNLNRQKVDLDTQKAQKQKLLTDTQNDETTYQRLLAQAQAQLAAFKSFVVTAGAGVISANQFGTGADGSYYSQRDERWAYKTIGYSSENILNVGCLLTSVAMVAKKLGNNVTPLDIAVDPSRFWGNTASMNYPWPSIAGKNYSAVNNIDQELQNGNYVIVGVTYSSCANSNGGDHYVVLTKKDGGDYIMNDPIYGPDLKFSSHYSTICSSGTFK
ncbi:C39 family peptidase [Candidatus Roizmanbacteria bacterium]|nr:C39 family peptidase [Candidatus Roizmanbacteria bacterium]